MGSKESGRSKYTPEVHAKIVEALKLGCFKKHAAAAAGIGWRTFEQWLTWADEGREPYTTLAYDCEVAIGEDAKRNQAIVSKAAAGEHLGDWKAAAWNLERKHPKLYGNLGIGHDKPAGDKPFSPWKLPAPSVRDNAGN